MAAASRDGQGTPARSRPWSVLAVMARHPGLWGEAIRAAKAFTPRRWWRRPPFLPLPSPSLMRWRIETAYGDPSAAIDPDDLVTYLQWRKRQRTRWGSRGG